MMDAICCLNEGGEPKGPGTVCGGLGATLYGAAHTGSGGASTFYTIDPNTGVATPVGPIGFNRVSGMDFDGYALYATGERSDGSGTDVLLTIDPATGIGTEVGPTGIGAFGNFVTVSDVSFRNSDNVLYAYLEAGDGVGTINTETGAAAFLGLSGLGPVGDNCCGNGMAFSPLDTLYQGNDNNLHTLNQATGWATIVVGWTWPPPLDGTEPGTRPNAMDFHPLTGVLYASINDKDFGGTYENYLGTIDPATGVVTMIGPTVDGLDAIAFGFGLEACCFPDGSCQNMGPLCCENEGGEPKGPGTQCLGVQACCFDDGTCQDMDAICCENEGGTPQGPGAIARGGDFTENRVSTRESTLN